MDMETKKPILKRCNALKFMQQTVGYTKHEVVKKFGINNSFLIVAENFGYIKKSNVGYCWNIKIEPNVKMAEFLLEKEKEYLIKHRPSLQVKNSIKEKTVKRLTQESIKIEYVQPIEKEYTVTIKGKNVIMGIEQFLTLIK